MATRQQPSSKRPTPTQIRAARRDRRRSRRRFLRVAAFSAVGFVAVAFIVALFLPGLPFGQGGRLGRGAPDGPGVRLPEQGLRGQDHINPGAAHPPYNSAPATSGWHYEQPLAPARWGVHDDALSDEVLVHNLEHGGIGVHYNCPEGCPELVGQLAGIVNAAVAERLKVIMAPYLKMDTRIALTAWTFIDKLDEFDEKRIKEFIRAHESSPNSPEPEAR